jgi:hypothetical protein
MQWFIKIDCQPKKILHMKNLIILFSTVLFAFGCSKDKAGNSAMEEESSQNVRANCQIDKTYADNAVKVTITNGIWGTVSFMQGNCMPTINPQNTTCTNCPVKRTVRIYEYTKQSQATPSTTSPVFFDAFSTTLVREVETDNEGFFQTEIPVGKYTLVVVENGKLYANGTDGQGGLNPFTFSSGKQKINLTLTYKATF